MIPSGTNKSLLNGICFILNKWEQCSDRYIEDETFLLELARMNAIQRMFAGKKIRRFIDGQLNKYDF